MNLANGNKSCTIETVDVLIIGSGPGGEGAAMYSAKAGLKVVVIEKHTEVGGGCTHWGTIPSKSLRQSVQQISEIRQNPILKAVFSKVKWDYVELLKQAKQVISQQVILRQGFYERNDVPVIQGQASIIDEHTVDVTLTDGGHQQYQAKFVIIATGSRPYRPQNLDFNHPRVLDSDTILSLNSTPHTITIYGAGVIGCEYASIFNRLGCRVNLINTHARLLSFLDEEIVDAVAYHFRDQGIRIRHNEVFKNLLVSDQEVCLQLESGKEIISDVFLWANGRTGNSDDLGLQNLNIQIDHRGQIKINEFFQTNVPHFYACGDVIGSPALASAAYDQGRFVGSHICYSLAQTRKNPPLKMDTLYQPQMIPTGIYTSPEVSSVGPTEQELTAQKIPYEVGHAQFRHLARAQITGQQVGMLKILFKRDTQEIISVHCFGAQASEIIHIGQIIMFSPYPHNTLNTIINTTFNYPTMAEAYRVAALNGRNKLRQSSCKQSEE